MIEDKDKPEQLKGVASDEALARYLQGGPEEVVGEFAKVRLRQEEVRQNAKETKEFIKRSGRPAGKRFRI